MNRLGARGHANYVAFIIHRLSGIALTAFLPLHFWALGTAIESEARFDSFLRWSAQPVVKFAELGLVALLAAHLAGGVRLLALEFVGWQEWQKQGLALALGVGVFAGLMFLLNAGA